MVRFSENMVLLQDQTTSTPQWFLFSNPIEIIETYSQQEVTACLKKIEQHVDQGKYAAGFLSYEASPGMDSALSTYTPTDFPVLRFLICDSYEVVEPLCDTHHDFTIGEWLPTVSREDYNEAIERIKAHIRCGDTYQVNYTMRLRTNFSGDSWDLFCRLYSAQKPAYSAYVKFDHYSICSISPELFFSLSNGKIHCKPMKGTVKRGLNNAEDKERADWLHHSEKNRSENVMIVDMIRNDIGMIAKTGTVQVDTLFAVERFPTVQQMTSTVSAEVQAPISEIIQKMFPCASITGAPKAKTMEIITQLEKDPRGIYTGSIGYIAPGGVSQFNVAIRTVVVNEATHCAEYGVGGGIVWDSTSEDEYEECKTKAAVLTHQTPSFDLLESLLWDPLHGFYLLEKHLARMSESAHYFQSNPLLSGLHGEMAAFQPRLSQQKLKIRVSLSSNGKVTIEEQALGSLIGYRIDLAQHPISNRSVFLRHKTTERAIYKEALASNPAAQDVILWNEDGFVTESSIANIVLKIDNELVTPPLEHGLLPGVFRQHLLEAGTIKEQAISKQSLPDASEIFLINSVRGWMPLKRQSEQFWTVVSENNFQDLPPETLISDT